MIDQRKTMSDDNDDEREFYVTTYCNRAHSLADGRALGEEGDDEWHECDELSPTKLRIEREFGPSAVKGSMTAFYLGERKALDNGDRDALEGLFWEHAPSMTLDNLLDQLIDLRKTSPLGGKTVVHVCLVDSGIEYLLPKRVRVETDADGAMVVLDIGAPRLSELTTEND